MRSPRGALLAALLLAAVSGLCARPGGGPAAARGPARGPARGMGVRRGEAVGCPAGAAYGRLDDRDLKKATLAWFNHVVVGHNLCPFAAAVRDDLRLVVVHGGRAEATAALKEEVALLLDVPPGNEATTLLLLPGADFADFENLMGYFQAEAEKVARKASKKAPIQVLPFHPLAAFADLDGDAADWATRSPVPVLHLLRDADVTRAEDGWLEVHEAVDIQGRNAAYLRVVGWNEMQKLQDDCWTGIDLPAVEADRPQ
ncbi:hypothetical protein M885DRAFT_507557 [Pelagophyceae sp. CCMP2097]|nr:hypothetical protein M885DRAFT_507557 [Pelagophyceae sp. CCMP2097]